MRPPNIRFHYEYNNYKIKKIRLLREWLNEAAMAEKKEIENINIIFCDDKYLLSINKKYLKHNYYTDIITFDYATDHTNLSGDIYISVERAKENAKLYKQPLSKEIHRLLIHGLLHLIGYNDKTKAEKKLMVEKEDFYLEKI